MKLYHVNSKGEQHMLSFDGKKKGFNTLTAGKITMLCYDAFNDFCGHGDLNMRVTGNINLEEMYSDSSKIYNLYDDILDIRMMRVKLIRENDGSFLIKTDYDYYAD